MKSIIKEFASVCNRGCFFSMVLGRCKVTSAGYGWCKISYCPKKGRERVIAADVSAKTVFYCHKHIFYAKGKDEWFAVNISDGGGKLIGLGQRLSADNPAFVRKAGEEFILGFFNGGGKFCRKIYSSIGFDIKLKIRYLLCQLKDGRFDIYKTDDAQFCLHKQDGDFYETLVLKTAQQNRTFAFRNGGFYEVDLRRMKQRINDWVRQKRDWATNRLGSLW